MELPQGKLLVSLRSEFNSIEVRQTNGLRLLRTDRNTVQSAMLLAQPQQLNLPYMRAMMAGLLFQPPPENVLILGLGGGDLVRYLHHQLPETNINAVELDETMLKVSREYFALPNSNKINIHIDDAMNFVSHENMCHDLILIDIYRDIELPAMLQDPAFYKHCHSQLQQNGIMVLNLLTVNAETFKRVLWMIRRQFHGSTLCLSVPDHVNIVIFAFRRQPTERTLPALLKTAERLNQRFELNFTEWVEQLFSTNPVADGELIFEMNR